MRHDALARWGLLATAIALGLVLIGTALASWSSARMVGQAAVLGQGERFLHLGRLVVDQEDPGAAAAELLADQEPLGLRYVSLWTRSGPVYEAGTPIGSAVERGPRPQHVGNRIRVQTPAGPRRRGHGGLVVVEFVPHLSLQVTRRSTATLGVSLLAAAGLMLLAAVFWRMSLQAEANRTELEQGRRLAALGEMSAVLAHEIRNPLASLKGHAQLLEEVLDAGPAATKASTVVGEAERLEGLVNQLLAFVRTGELDRDVVPIGPLIRDAMARSAPEATLAMSDPELRWSVDGPRLERVLGNLLDNAVAAGGPIQVTAAARGSELVIEVRDHGPGVEDTEAIFTPFHTTRTRGVGLGLAVARRIVERHRGQLTAANADPGARFTLRIPEED